MFCSLSAGAKMKLLVGFAFTLCIVTAFAGPAKVVRIGRKYNVHSSVSLLASV